MERIELEEVDSTNSWLAAHVGELGCEVMLTARRQSAGRGQRGNSWEAQPGKNLTVSMLWKPDSFPAAEQFGISEGVALAVVDTLADFGAEAKVKWPNDIYVGDRKICGILIEHAVAGRYIMHSICGIGLNVNQQEFLSDAPNPVSLRQLLGRDLDLDSVLTSLETHLSMRLGVASQPVGRSLLHDEYMQRLWRGDGRLYPFATPGGERFDARIADVAPGGLLTLITSSGDARTFAFKEVSFELP